MKIHVNKESELTNEMMRDLFQENFPNLEFHGFYDTNDPTIKNIFTTNCPNLYSDQNCRSCQFANKKTLVCEQPLMWNNDIVKREYLETVNSQ